MRVSLPKDHSAIVDGRKRSTLDGQVSPGSFAHILLTGLLLIALPAIGLTKQGHPGQPASRAHSHYRSGVLNANLGKVLEINGRRYQLHQDVKVTDDEGNEQDPAIMRAGDALQFQVKKGTIRRIIWMMPR